MGIKDNSTIELMNMYADILSELNTRGVLRTYNSPVGDYAEWLAAEKLGLLLARNSEKGFDALDAQNGSRYQIKSRWERGVTSVQSRELSIIRNYDEKQFDYLIVLIFGAHFDVKEAYAIPHDTISRYAKYNKHQNGYILTAKDDVLYDPNVSNLTPDFR